MRSPAIHPAFRGRPDDAVATRSFYLFGDDTMLYWALIFFIGAIIAGVLGLGGIAGAMGTISKVLSLFFAVLLLVSPITGWVRRPPASSPNL